MRVGSGVDVKYRKTAFAPSEEQNLNLKWRHLHVTFRSETRDKSRKQPCSSPFRLSLPIMSSIEDSATLGLWHLQCMNDGSQGRHTLGP